MILKQKAEIMLDRLRKVTEEISGLLDCQEDFDQNKINDLDSLYSERKKIIEDISAFAESREGHDFISGSLEHWNIKFSDIMYAETINIKKIKEILNQKESGLRTLISQKSLLIYTKDESHGY